MNPRDELIARLISQPAPQIVSIAQFLAGNNDPGSIGCNLLDHPGLNTFRAVFDRLTDRPDVDAVYAQIAELDPGAGSWPFADTVFVVGNIARDHLVTEMTLLQPDEVSLVAAPNVPSPLSHHAQTPVHLVWWD